MCWFFSLGAVEGFTPLCLVEVIRPIICLFSSTSQNVATYSGMWHPQCARAYITLSFFFQRVLYLMMMMTLRRLFVAFAPLYRTEQLLLGGATTEILTIIGSAIVY